MMPKVLIEEIAQNDSLNDRGEANIIEAVENTVEANSSNHGALNAPKRKFKLREKLDITGHEQDLIPTQDEVDKIATSKKFYEANLPDIQTNKWKYAKSGTVAAAQMPWNIAYGIYTEKDKYKLMRYLVVAILLKWDDLLNEFKRTAPNLRVGKLDIQAVKDTVWKNHITDILNMINKANLDAYNGVTITTNYKGGSPNSYKYYTPDKTQPVIDTNNLKITIKADPNTKFCRIIASLVYPGTKSRAARHLLIRKKNANGLYWVGVEGSGLSNTPSNCEPVFDSVQQAENFIRNVDKINTTANFNNYEFTISDKPARSGISDLSNCTKVTTICGPAYIQNNSQYYAESLEEDTEKVKDGKWVNRGEEGTHGTFKTKKEADAQRKAMFANGYHEDLEEGLSRAEMIAALRKLGKNYYFDKYTDGQIYNIYIKAIYNIYIKAVEKAKRDAEVKQDDIEDVEIKRCQKCGMELNASGECPACDLDERDLDEDIEKHNELNPKLWDGDTLKDEVKDKINQIVDEFIEGLKDDEIKFKLDDVWLTGSNASLNWTKNSDLDVHLLFDLSIYTDEEKQAMADLLYSYYTKNWRNKLTITIYGIPVELYIETNYEK